MPGDPLLFVGCWLAHRDAPYNYSHLATRGHQAVIDEQAILRDLEAPRRTPALRATLLQERVWLQREGLV